MMMMNEQNRAKSTIEMKRNLNETRQYLLINMQGAFVL